MRTESVFLYCVIENEAHLESITGLLGNITTQEINYNSRAMQILQLQACAVIFNDVYEPASLFITNIHTVLFTCTHPVYSVSFPPEIFEKSLSVCCNFVQFSQIMKVSLKPFVTDQWIKCTLYLGKGGLALFLDQLAYFNDSQWVSQSLVWMSEDFW